MTDSEEATDTSVRSAKSAVPSATPLNAAAVARIEPAMSLLWDARCYSEELRIDIWEFAVDLDCLLRSGLTRPDARWLVEKGFLELRREISLPGDFERSYVPCRVGPLPESACFVITPQGIKFRRELDDFEVLTTPHDGESPVPVWDSVRHELRVRNLLIKRFKVPAGNQEAILGAFQEEGWPARIDDPLSPRRGQEPKRRLHDTINSLNRNQKRRLIHFSGDGTGQGVCWNFVDPT